MRDYFSFDLERRNILASTPYRVFDSINEKESSLRVASKRIPGMKPPIAPRTRGGFWHLVITLGNRPGKLGAQDQLSNLPDGHFDIVRVDDAAFDSTARSAAALGGVTIDVTDNRHRRLSHAKCGEIGKPITSTEFGNDAIDRRHESHPEWVLSIVRMFRIFA